MWTSIFKKYNHDVGKMGWMSVMLRLLWLKKKKIRMFRQCTCPKGNVKEMEIYIKKNPRMIKSEQTGSLEREEKKWWWNRESLAVTQFCLRFQEKLAGRGRQTGWAGLWPGHTLCHAAQEKPRLEGHEVEGLGWQNQRPALLPQHSNRPQGSHCVPSSTTWHIWSAVRTSSTC